MKLISRDASPHPQDVFMNGPPDYVGPDEEPVPDHTHTADLRGPMTDEVVLALRKRTEERQRKAFADLKAQGLSLLCNEAKGFKS